MSHDRGPLASRRLISFAFAGDAAGVQTNTTYPTRGGVAREELDRHIAELYRDVANEAGRDLHFSTGRPLAEARGYPVDVLGLLPTRRAGRRHAGFVSGPTFRTHWRLLKAPMFPHHRRSKR